MSKHRLHDGRVGSAMTVHVTPRARKDELTGIAADGTLKIRLTAAPVDGAANKALLELLAKILGIRASALEITGGEKGRDKIISVVGMDTAAVEEKIHKYVQEHSPADE